MMINDDNLVPGKLYKLFKLEKVQHSIFDLVNNIRKPPIEVFRSIVIYLDTKYNLEKQVLCYEVIGADGLLHAYSRGLYKLKEIE